MTKGLIAVLLVAVVGGLAAGAVWGRYVGVGVFAMVAVVGSMIVVLRRNQRDLREVEAGLPPGDVGDAIREAPPFEPRRRPPRD